MEPALQTIREVFESELEHRNRLVRNIQAIAATTGVNEYVQIKTV